MKNDIIANPRLANSYIPNMLRSSFSGNDNSMNVSGIQTELNLDLVRGDRRDSLYESVLKPENRDRSRSPMSMREEESLY